jgi:hypothetical protein
LPDPHKSKKCDHIITIAEKYGYKDWNTLWDANKDLQNSRDRKNPLVLFTGDSRWDGDEIELSPKEKPDFKQPTDKDGKYQVPKEPKLCLRLRILKGDFTPIKDADFELAVKGGKTYKGKTTDKGRVQPDGKDPEIPKTCTEATLAVRVAQEETDAGSQDGGGGDKKEKDSALAGDCRLKWTLQIGRLNPIMEKAHTKYCISGVQQRLNNLGFYCGPVDGIKGPNTKFAIEKFQSLFGLNVDNIPGTKETQPKLQEIHDTDKAVKIPEGEKKPTKTEVKPEEFRKTTPADVGHVAPDLVDSKEPFVNTLVVAPEYRIKLDMGKIEDLFLHRPEEIKGQLERLQVLGLFYFPMNHKKAWDQAKKDANEEPSEAGLFAWNYYRRVLGGTMNELPDKVQKFVVDSGKLPPPGPEGNNKPDKKHFAKIRVPGGYTYVYEYPDTFRPNYDPTYKIPMEVEKLPEAEKMVSHDNPVVGAIPLKAFVESRYGASGAWKPAKDVMVYFQLIKPYDLPDFDAKVSPAEQINRPPLRQTDMQTDPAGNDKTKGPAKLDGEVNSGLGDDDPQKPNCNKSHGGYAGEATAFGNVFENKVDLSKYGDAKDEKWRPGFYEAHTGLRSDVVKEPFMEKPEDAAPEGVKYKHAVRAKTNKDGFVGVIFKPSLKGGDCYRLRVFVGPPTLPGNDGTGPDAVAVETGTLVVWRNIRVSKVLQMPCKKVAKVVQTQIVEQTKGFLGKIKHALTSVTSKTLMFETGISKKNGTHVGYPYVDLSPKGDSKCVYDGFVKQMARAFCEVELDPGAEKPQELKDKEWRAALKFAIDHCKEDLRNRVLGVQEIEVDNLFLYDDDPKRVGVTAEDSFVLIPFRAAKLYNKMVSANNRKIKVKDNGELEEAGKFHSWFKEHVLFPFVYKLADKAFLPGLTMLQMPTMGTWQYIGLDYDFAVGVGFRTCIVYGGKDMFPYEKRQTTPKTVVRPGTNYYLDDYGFSALMAHEWGHCLFRQHAPPSGPGNRPQVHDPVGNGYCVMTYDGCEGDFCAKCLFGLRGWTKLDTLP